MTDPNADAARLARGSAVDLSTFGERREADKTAAGVMLALANLPPFENVTLGGRVVATTIEDDAVRIQIVGVGSTRSYTIALPGDYLRQVVEQLDATKAEREAATSEGEKPEDPQPGDAAAPGVESTA